MGLVLIEPLYLISGGIFYFFHRITTLRYVLRSNASHLRKFGLRQTRYSSSFDLLVIDEYGLHDRHEKRLEMVHKILYSRYDSMKSTLLISNFTLQNMQQDLGVRLWSRLHENTLIVVPCYWDDHRITG